MNAGEARPKVSVVIPIYKVEKYLVRCLESVVNQTLRELEIILVDEGDQDRCREIVDFYEQADSRVVAIHEPNPGASYGAKVNRGIDRATGEFVAIVESDDFIGAEMYEQMYECAVRTGANIVKTPFYNYRTKEDNVVDKSRAYISVNVPKEKPFSIFQFPHLLAMHPSPWSAIYRRDELQRQKVRCLEAPKAGYVDNCFYLDAYVRMGKIVWLNKPFYRWRRTNEDSSSRPENWNRPVMLERWNRNLDMYPIQSEKYSVFAPFFANKAWTSVCRHYLEGWEFDEGEYAALTAFLRRFSEEQLMAAVRVSAEHREQMLLCRNDPEGFRAAYFPASLPQESVPEPESAETMTEAAEEEAAESEKLEKEKAEKEKAEKEKAEKERAEKEKAEKERAEKDKAKAKKGPKELPMTRSELFCAALAGKSCRKTAFCGAAYLLLASLAVKAGVFGALLPETVCGPLAAGCALLSVLCLPVLACSFCAGMWKKRRKERAGRD